MNDKDAAQIGRSLASDHGWRATRRGAACDRHGAAAGAGRLLRPALRGPSVTTASERVLAGRADLSMDLEQLHGVATAHANPSPHGLDPRSRQ